MTPSPSSPAGAALERLAAIVERLRDPQTGCPWDRVQTLETLKPCLIEESYELLDKMAGDDVAAHREELGDVMLQAVFQASIRAQRGEFSLADALNGVCDKLVRRHPHVFGDTKVGGADDVLSNWERIKRAEGNTEEGHAPKSPFAGIPKALPGLLKAQRAQAKAARAGFEPIPKSDAWDALEAALAALKAEAAAHPAASESPALAASDAAIALKRRFGEAAFALAALARSLDLDAESALGLATNAFMERSGLLPSQLSPLSSPSSQI